MEIEAREAEIGLSKQAALTLKENSEAHDILGIETEKK